MAQRNAILMLCVLLIWQAAPLDAGDVPDFDSDVLPLLAAKCGKCHGNSTRKGDLDLSSINGIQRGGESGDPLLGSTLEESAIWRLVEGGDMPPPEEPQLTSEERAVLREWIEARGLMQDTGKGANLQSQHDVLPILLLRCATCHGPQRQDGGLDLWSYESMMRGGKKGAVVVPGDPDKSPLIQRIESEACPPRELLLKFFVRRPAGTEVDQLRHWIADGARPIVLVPDVATTDPDPLVSDEDRKHWAFQPPKVSQATGSIDDFIEAKLAEHGMALSPEADRETLIRRAYFDLIGLPPDYEEFERWSRDEDPLWYSRMVEHLLASPHYGERWGRYWLDLAGYADSEGGISADPLRPVAWKYRDYVIRALNSDKPYDRFLLEQLAGDELVDFEHADIITQEMIDNLIATGFLRMGIDETGSRTMNFVPERLKVISDAITVVSSGVMGLTMECARCHSHKYDAIPQRDYYRFKAIFQGALDEHDWRSFKTRTLMVATEEQLQAAKRTNPPLETEIKKLTAEQKETTAHIHLELLRHHYPDQSETDNQATLVALKQADNNRTLPQKILVEKLQKAELLPDAQQPESVLSGWRRLSELQLRIDRIERQMVPSAMIRALWDSGHPSPTYMLRRGEYDKPGPLVGPGVPSVLTDGRTPFTFVPPFPDGTARTGRRLAFARWLTQADHPLTGRVMVNRIWYHHFGRGLVKELDNFGVQGSPPSHPELLDWLAVEFAGRGWSIKEMHRLMMNSRTYRQSSRLGPEIQQKDPLNQLWSRMPLRRLDAEALRDSMLFVAGKLDPRQGGLPDTVSVDREGMVSVNPSDAGSWRRSIYLQFRRTEIPTFMDTFDYPQMGPNCLSRNVSIVAPQSLWLKNSEHVHELASALGRRVSEGAGKGEGLCNDPIDYAYRLVLSREPGAQEKQLGQSALKELETAWQGSREKALETYCHMLLNSAAFLYVD